MQFSPVRLALLAQGPEWSESKGKKPEGQKAKALDLYERFS